MSLGYQIPGVVITEQSKPASFSTTSSRRRPCAIGVASPYKKVSYEEVVRAVMGDDALAHSNDGIFSIKSVGAQKGLNNFKEGVHFQLLNNNISWLPKIYNQESVIVSDVLTPVNYNVSISTPVSGEAATSGFCNIITSPNTVVGAVPHGIPAGTYTLRVSVDGGPIQNISVVVTNGQTWTQLVSAITVSGAVVSIADGHIEIRSSSTGSNSSVSINDGVINGLIDATSKIGRYFATIDAPVNGADSTASYAEIDSGSYIMENTPVGVAEQPYFVKVTVDSGAASDVLIALSAGAVWGDVVDALSAVTGVSVSIVGGKVRVTSNTLGTGSSVVLAAGGSSDFVAALISAGYTGSVYSAKVNGSNATVGYTGITTAPTTIIPSVQSRIPAGSYKLKINANNNGETEYTVPITAGLTWSGIVSAINASDVKNVAIVSISGGKLRFTSKIAGSISNVVIVDGSSNGLIAAISGVLGLYNVSSFNPVVGNNATAGYVDVTSTPENFSATKKCNLPSGNYNISVGVDGGASEDFQIVIAGQSQTWKNIVDTANSASAPVAFSIVDGKLRISSKTFGTSSDVVVADGSSSGLFAAMDNLTSTEIELKVNRLSYDRSITEAKVSTIVDLTTYEFTLKYSVEEGDTVLTLVGDAADIEKVASNSVLHLSNVSTWLAAGSKYFVSYEYVRPDADYNAVKIFTDYNAVVEDLGDDIPANKLVMWAKLALTAYGNADIAVVQIKSETKTNYLNALEKIKYISVQDVFPLTADDDVRSYVVNHVIERSLPENKYYRMSYFGAAAGTPVGTDEVAGTLKGMAAGIKHERCHLINATRGRYYYNDPANPNTELSTIVDGSFIAAIIGAYRCSFSDPTVTLINKVISGVDLLDEDFHLYYDDYQLKSAGESSCFLVKPSTSGGILVVDDLTTDNSTIERNCTNIITAKDYIAKDLAININRVFTGTNVYNVSDYEANLQKFLKNLMLEYKRNGVIAAVGATSAKRHPVKKNTFIIFYSYDAVYTHKYTEGSFEINQ